jgi:hypothetical protein
MLSAGNPNWANGDEPVSDPIRISASGFAEFVTSSSRSRANKLRPFKFRNRGEGAGRSSYYQWALKAIRAYHRANQDEEVFERALEEIQDVLGGTVKRLESTKLKQNQMAIAAYRSLYGERKFVIQKNHRLAYKIGQVTVTAQPDLWVEENGTQVLLKIGMARKGTEFINVLLFIIHAAAVASGYGIGARNVVYLDIDSGIERTCDDRGGNYRSLFRAGAREIATVWPTILGPTTGAAPNVT